MRPEPHDMRIIAAGSSLLAALAVAACGGSGSPATTVQNVGGSGGATVSGSKPVPVATTTVTHTATASARPATTSSQSGSGGVALPSASGSTTTAAAARPCAAPSLKLSFLGQQGATGHGELGFALRNTDSSSCSTFGYPGVQFLDRAGAALPTVATHTTSDFFGHTGLHALALAAGQSASFRLGVTHGAGSSAGCTTADALRVIAPNDTATLTVAIPDGATECATVSPLQPGGAGYP